VRRDDGEIRSGAFETFGAGRSGADISCACHWATNTAASQHAGQLVAAAYSVAPCAIMVPPESPVRRAEDLAGVGIGVGFHSEVPAATMWGVPLYIAEAFGFRKVLDATFMIGFLVTGSDVTRADVDRYLAALRRAQMEIDLHPEAYKHYHLRSVPEKYRAQVDVRAFGTGERVVFLPYTREAFAATAAWTEAHQIFTEPPTGLSSGYDDAVLT
jgi:NitT/TauT family transport system substrate-binding protein